MTYFEGAADLYQIPLAMSIGSQADAITGERPDSVLTILASSSGPAVLHDATVREDFRQIELKLIERNSTVPLARIEIPEPVLVAQSISAESGDASRIATGEHSTQPIGGETKPIIIPTQPLPLDVQPGEAASEPRPDASEEAGVSANGQTPGSTASLNARASSALRELNISGMLESRVGSAEQSNTSLIYGDASDSEDVQKAANWPESRRGDWEVPH